MSMIWKIFTDDCRPSSCSSSRTPNMSDRCNRPSKKTLHILDNDLRLRSMTNETDCDCAKSSSSSSSTIQNGIGRFDELLQFFNIINGLFRQSAFTFGLSSNRLTPFLHLPKMDVGANMYIDQQSLEQHKVNFLKNITFYSLIGRNVLDPTESEDQQRNIPMGIIKFHTSNKNLMLSVNHHWTSSLATTLRFGTVPHRRLWSHVEYRRPNETYELIGAYNTQNSSSLQFSCLSSLWHRANYQLDGGIDFQITSKEKLAEIGLRLKHSSTSIVFKYEFYHPFKHFMLGIQRCINTYFTIGLLAENLTDNRHPSSIKLSLISQWQLNRTGLRVNTLMNSQNELGVAITHQIRHFPLVLQTFGVYSWTMHKCKWGVGLQINL